MSDMHSLVLHSLDSGSCWWKYVRTAVVAMDVLDREYAKRRMKLSKQQKGHSQSPVYIRVQPSTEEHTLLIECTAGSQVRIVVPVACSMNATNPLPLPNSRYRCGGRCHSRATWTRTRPHAPRWYAAQLESYRCWLE